MEPETCSVTGSAAYASFKEGFGSAWYGSAHDTRLFADMTGTFDGPVCDEVLWSALARGDVRCYGSYMSGLSKASEIDAEVAARLFARGAARQAAELAAPPADPEVSAFLSKKGGVTCVSRVARVAAPAWQAPVFGLVRSSRDGLSPSDFETQGALWALARRAASADPSDASAMRAASDASHAHALECEAAQREADESFDVFGESLGGMFPPRQHSFVVRIRLPAPEAFDAAVEALGEAGCTDATISTNGEGLLVADFDREAIGLPDALSSAVRAITLALPADHVLVSVTFGESASPEL